MPEPDYNVSAVSSAPTSSPSPQSRPSGLGSRSGRNMDADMYAGSSYAPTSNAGTSSATQTFSSSATSTGSFTGAASNKSDDGPGYAQSYNPAAALYSNTATAMTAAGATLKAPTQTVYNPMNLYSMPTMQEVSTEIKDYLRGTAIDDAMREALNLPEVYQGAQTEEEPDPNITDPGILRDALQPEPITVEELPDVITKAGDTLSAIAASVDLPLQAVIDANPQIANPDMIRPGQKINMPSRSLTGEERTALSDMSDITKAQGQTITSNGSFSLPKLKDAVKGSIDNTKKQAMLEGIVDVEVGTDGPRTEDPYSLSNLEGFTGAWRQRSIDAGLLDGNGNATPLARQLNSQGALGDTIFDVQYAGRNGNGDLASGDGSTFKGRGLVQITGRQNYQEVQNRLQEQGINIDLINNPELVNDERYALPAAIAYLDYAGMTDSAAEEMSARKLQAIINPAAPVATAEERWESAMTALRSEDPVAAAEMEKRNEYEAQRTVGAVVDGLIGPNSERDMRSWLQQEGVTVPANATGMDLVVLVNENS